MTACTRKLLPAAALHAMAASDEAELCAPVATQNRLRQHRFSSKGPPIRNQFLSVLVGLCAFAALVSSAELQAFPGSPVDSRTLEVQEKVDELFEAGEFERAMFIYKNELAPIGDKYAQYMIGYMYLVGAGVNEDPVTASAWYRLAAERENSQFEAVRDQLLASLAEVDKGRSDELYLQLKQRYSDAVILLELIRDDLQTVSARTGSRISTGRGSGSAGSLVIVDPRAGSSVSGDAFYQRLADRLNDRAKFLLKALGSRGEVGAAAGGIDFARLEDLVNEYVETIDDR